jgi:hypothetical protein
MNLDSLEPWEGTDLGTDIANQERRYVIPKNPGLHLVPGNLGLKLISDLQPRILL